MPATFSGLAEAVANSVTDREEVFVANMASPFATLSNSPRTDCLIAISSTAASITRSTALKSR